MLKVYVKGFGKPYGIEGSFVGKDDDHLVLSMGSIKKLIPLEQIAWMEDDSGASERVPEPPKVPAVPPPTSTPSPNITKEDIKRVIQEQMKRPEPPPQVLTEINVFISGAEEANLSIRVPEDVITGDHYSPALSREIAKNSEIRTIMDRGIIFDGVPTVASRNVYIKTRRLKETVANAGASMNNIGLLAKAFQKPERHYRSDFAIMSGAGKSDVLDSPWQGPVKLGEDTDVHSSEQEDGSEGESSS